MNEMSKLISLLENAGIPYETAKHRNGSLQVCYPKGPAMSEDCVCDVICFSGSYGGNIGLLEICGLVNEEVVGDTVEGWLTADTVFGRIQEHYADVTRFKMPYIYMKKNNGLSRECNRIVDYIIHSSPDIKVLAEEGEYVYVKAAPTGVKLIEFLKEKGLLSAS